VKILGIDTSTENCSIALVENCKVLIHKSVIGKSVHAEMITELLYEVKKSGINFDELDGIAVTNGPGSYTGLRIGLSFAKGMAIVINKPILPVPTFSSLYHRVKDEVDEYTILFIRSYSNYVFYVKAGDENNLFDKKPDVDSVESLVEKFQEVKRFIGNYPFNLDNKEVLVRYPDSVDTAILGCLYFDKLKALYSFELEPYYFSEFKAVKWK